MKPSRFLPWLAGLTLLAGVALAQTPPAPAADPTPAAEPLPMTLHGLSASPGEEIDTIKWTAEPLVNVLRVLESLTGRSVIRPPSLPTPDFAFNSYGKMTRQDAVLAIESLLSLNGIAVAPLGEKFIKVVPTSVIRTEAPELVVGSLRDRAPSGRIVSKLFRLQHLDLNSFQQQIQPFLSPGFGGFVPFQNSSTVLVTDSVSNLQRLEYVIGEVDKPRNIITKFYTLKFAQAQQVAEKIRSMIESTRTAFNRQGNTQGGGAGGAVPQPGAPMPPPGMPQGGGESGISNALLSSSVSLNFDERTNQIILVSDPTSVSFFDNLIEKLDVQADPSTQIAVIQLQHANASEVRGVLSAFISGTTTARSSTSSRASGTSAQQSRTTRGTTGLRNTFATQNQTQARNQNAQFNPAALNPGGAAVGGGGERNSQFSEGMTVQEDERSNAIVASGTQDDLNLLRELIKQLDVVLPQVQIDVLIVTASLGDDVQRGIDAFTGVEVVNNKITKIAGVSGMGFSIANLIPNGNGLFNGTGAVTTSSNTKSKIRVLSVPSITTTHNQKATIIVGDSIAIKTSSLDDGTTSGVTTRNSYTYQDVGLQLEVTPLIGSDGTVQMQIDQSADELGAEADANGQPPISRRQATSFITVRDGEIIVLGGLQKETHTKASNRLPILGEIPLIGGLFGNYKRNNTRNEVMFFIQPHVLLTTDRANEVGQAALKRSPLNQEIRVHIDRNNPDVPPTLVEPAKPASNHGPR